MTKERREQEATFAALRASAVRLEKREAEINNAARAARAARRALNRRLAAKAKRERIA